MFRLLILTCFFVACHDPGSGDSSDPDAQVDPTGIALRQDGWLRGDLHVHAEFEPVSTALRLAEYLDDPTFLDFHPEYEGNHLDFLAITDHDSCVASDPTFVSDKLVLIPGVEVSMEGHANTLGVREALPPDSDGDGVISLDDVLAMVSSTQVAGGVFSPNHAFIPDIPFPWDLREIEAVEAWNGGWIVGDAESTAETLASWEADHGPAAAPFARGLQVQGAGDGGQLLAWYEALLSRGVHAALIGGSDHHAFLLPGFPTTWVQSTGSSEEAVLQGIRERHTFVARTPASAQVLVGVESTAGPYIMGDEVPVASSGEDVVVTFRVGRAFPGRLQVVLGGPVATDEALATAPLGSVVLDEEVTSSDHTARLIVHAVPGTWFYPRVLEPLVRDDATTAQAARIPDFADGLRDVTDIDSIYAFLVSVSDIVDMEIVGEPSRCDPEQWQPDQLQCVPGDVAAFFVPDLYDRAMNATTEGGSLTGWTMGAIGSAILFVDGG